MEAISPWLTREHVVGLLSILWPAYVAVVGVWIVLQRRAPVATLSWLLSMAVIPVLGLVIYYFLGPRRLKRQRLRRLRSRRRSRVRGSMARLKEKVPQAPERLHQVVKLVAAATNFPVSTADRVELLVGGAATFDSILAAVRQARQHIHLEYYIFEPDQTGLGLIAALCEKAREGVAVRLLVDAVNGNLTSDPGGRIAIRDYDPAEDQLDLSLLGMIRSTAQLVFRPQSYGIKIFYNDTVIDIYSADGRTLLALACESEHATPALVERLRLSLDGEVWQEGGQFRV